jgi:tetratricopeptide (TPR) repeat protein
MIALLFACLLFISTFSTSEGSVAYGQEATSENYVLAGDKAVEAGRFSEAESKYSAALALIDKPNSYNNEVARILIKLGELHRTQKEYSKAEPLYRRAIAILDWNLGPDDLEVATTLNYLANVYDHLDGHYSLAGALYHRVLAIREHVLGPEHPDVAESLDTLGLVLYFPNGRLVKGEPLFQRALAIREKSLGPDHLQVAVSLSTLAFLYDVQGRYEKAEPFYLRALTIREKNLGPDAPQVLQTVYNLGVLYSLTHQYDKAEAFHKRRLLTLEKVRGPDHPDVASALTLYSSVLRELGRIEEAAALDARAKKIQGTAKKGSE